MASVRKTSAKTITLSTNLIKRLEQMAIEENRNFSNLVETILLSATKEVNKSS